MAAAIALLVLAGGAAAIVPDIVPGEWFGRRTAEPVPEFAPAAAAPTELLMPASSSTLSVVLERPRPGLRVRMRREERTSLRIQATGAAAGALFRSANDMITITDAGAGELLLVIPRDASVRVTADGVLWAGTEGGDLLVHAPVVDTIGADVLILVPVQ